jgi:Spy/CpxP family protein refolding chaperone
MKRISVILAMVMFIIGGVSLLSAQTPAPEGAATPHPGCMGMGAGGGKGMMGPQGGCAGMGACGGKGMMGPQGGCAGMGACGGKGMMGPQGGCMGPCGGGEGMGGCNLIDCKEVLNLTDDQIAKIKDLNFAHKNQMIDLDAALEKAQLKMHHEMRADSPDKAKALAAAKEVNAVKGQIAEAKISHQFALMGVLNAEQLKKWKNCMTECRQSCGPGMGMGSCKGKGDNPGHGMMEKGPEGCCKKGR